MHLLFVVHGYPPNQNTGAEMRAARTARALAARGHTVEVLAVASLDDPGGFGRQAPRTEDGVRVHRLHGVWFPRYSAELDDDNRHIAASVAEILAPGSVDLVHQFSGYVTSSAVIRTARAHHVPVVVSLTDYWWLCRQVTLVTSRNERCDGPTATGCARCLAEKRRRWRWFTRAAPGVATAFWNRLAPSRLLSRRLPVWSEGARPARMVQVLNEASALVSPSTHLAEVYVRHGVERERLFVSRQGVQTTGLPSRTPSPTLRVGYIGQVKRHKGVDVLLDAWALLGGTRPRQLTIHGSAAGEPEYGRQIQQRLSRLEDARWPGSFLPEDRWKTLVGLDVVVVPSRWMENSPNVVLEAAAMGVVVVASRIGGAPELVRDGYNGLLVDPDSPHSLAGALQRLIDEPDTCELLGRHASESLRPTADEIDELEQLYGRIRGRPATRPHDAPVA